MTKHYVEFIYPGLIFSNNSEEEVGHRDPARVTVAKNCVQFRFFDREVGEMSGHAVTSEAFNYSAEYYPDGIVLTREDVERLYPSESTLLSNMRINGWDSVVRNRLGGFMSPPSGREVVTL